MPEPVSVVKYIVPRSIFEPITRVIDDLAKLRLDAVALDAEIAVRGAVPSGPSPNAIEHSSMQPAKKHFVRNISFPVESPTISFEDILLLELVELAAQGDVRGDQPLPFLRRQRRRIVIVRKRLGHFSSQRRAGRRNNSSTRRRRNSLVALPGTAWFSSRIVCSTLAS
jgi:hypothetical protein